MTIQSGFASQRKALNFDLKFYDLEILRKIRRFLESIGLLAFVMASSTALSSTQAQANLRPHTANELELTFVSDDKTLDPTLASSWNTFCEKFATQFLIGKGPQGRGIFEKKACRSKAKKSKKSSVSDWRFAFMSSESKVSVQGYYKNFSIFTLHFPQILNSNRIFSSPDAMQFAVAQVYRSLPAAWKISLPKGATQWDLPAFDPEQMPGENPVSHALFFTLYFDQDRKIWLPKVYAVAKKDQNVRNTPDQEASPSALPLVYLPNQDQRLGTRTLWAQELHPYQDVTQYKNLIYLSDDQTVHSNEGTSKSNEYISFSSFRYLKPFPGGETAATQSSKVDLTLSLTKGLLNGLNLSFEKSIAVPEDEVNSSRFSFLRQSASWRIGLGLDSQIQKVSSQFRLAPRIGFMTIDSKFPVRTDRGRIDNPLSFRTKNQLELGGELHWQLQMNPYTLSITAANNLSGYVLKKAGAAMVSNQRLSGSFHYRSPFDPWGIAVGFESLIYLDWLSLQNDQETSDRTQASSAESDTASKAVSLTILYLGLGLTLSW